MERPAGLAHWMAFIGLTCLVGFGVVLLVLHVLAVMQGHVPRYISHFRLVGHSWLWLLGLTLFAVGSTSLCMGLVWVLPPGGWSRAGLISLWVVPFCAAAVAIFPAAAPGAHTDISGRIHEGAAIGMFVSLGIAMLCFFVALRRHTPVLAWSSLATAIGFFLIAPWMVYGFIHGTADVMYSERIVVAMHGLWLLSVGLWSRAELTPIVAGRRQDTPQPQSTR